MEEFLSYLVTKIVSNKESVSIKKEEDSYGITYAITVAPDDFGRIIGKKGRTINSLRVLFNLYLHTNNLSSEKRVYVKVVEN